MAAARSPMKRLLARKRDCVAVVVVSRLAVLWKFCGRIENICQGVADIAQNFGVNGAAGLAAVHPGTAGLQVQLARGLKDGIADLLRFQPVGVPTPEQTVFGIGQIGRVPPRWRRGPAAMRRWSGSGGAAFSDSSHP